MKRNFTLLFAATACALACGTTGAQANDPQTATAPASLAPTAPRAWTAVDAEVYVDRETRFAFIKTPSGWRFIRRIEPAKMAQVPAEFLVPVGERLGALGTLSAQR